MGLELILVRLQPDGNIVAGLSCGRVCFLVDLKPFIVTGLSLSSHKEPFVQIMPYIIDSQFRVQNGDAPDFIPFLKQVQDIFQKRVQILDLALEKHAGIFNVRGFSAGRQAGLDTDLGIPASGGKNKGFFLPQGPENIIRNMGKIKPGLDGFRVFFLFGNIVNISVGTDDLCDGHM